MNEDKKENEEVVELNEEIKTEMKEYKYQMM